jgi:hypothetical protein
VFAHQIKDVAAAMQRDGWPPVAAMVRASVRAAMQRDGVDLEHMFEQVLAQDVGLTLL